MAGADQSHSPGKLIGVAGGGEGAVREAGLDAAQDEAEAACGDRHSETLAPSARPARALLSWQPCSLRCSDTDTFW